MECGHSYKTCFRAQVVLDAFKAQQIWSEMLGLKGLLYKYVCTLQTLRYGRFKEDYRSVHNVHDATFLTGLFFKFYGIYHTRIKDAAMSCMCDAT